MRGIKKGNGQNTIKEKLKKNKWKKKQKPQYGRPIKMEKITLLFNITKHMGLDDLITKFVQPLKVQVISIFYNHPR